MEDNLNFLKMEDDLNFFEDDINRLKMEDDLILLEKSLPCA